MNGVRKAKLRKGSPPNKQTSIFASESVRVEYITAYLTHLISDAVCIFKGHYSNADATHDQLRVVTRLRAEGSGFATKTLPTLSQGMFSLLEHGVTSFPQFKLLRGTEYPVFLNRLFNLVFNSVDQNLRTKAIDFIYSFSVSFKKLKGEYPQAVVRKLFSDFVKTDVDLNSIDFFSKELRPILEDARAQWRMFVKDSKLKDRVAATTPQPGPGATNSPTKKHMRYRPHVFYKQLDDVMPYDEWFYPNQWYFCHADGFYDGVYNCRVESPCARFKAVPKTAGKPRGICIEENEMQFFQQAIRKAMYEAITDYYGDNIALRKQSVNASLALSSSVTLDFATIDMSEASDRVARFLVSYLAQDDPWFRDLLMGLSTRYVIPPDEVKDEYPARIPTAKYAPMGSALCFPVMSLVHMVLVRSIIRLSTPADTRHSVEQVYVYGDDIILPAKFVEDVYAWLPKFGMKLNKDKSYYRSNFRESCGVHAFNGTDITPVYNKYIPYHDCADAQASVLAVESQLVSKGFNLTAIFLRRKIKEEYGKLYEVPDGLSLSGFARPHTDCLLDSFKKRNSKRWNRNLQCTMYQVTSYVKRVEHEKFTCELDRYMRWLCTNAKNEGRSGHSFEIGTVGDSRGALIKATRIVPESAIGKSEYTNFVFDCVTRYPTCPTVSQTRWFGVTTKHFVAAQCFAYL